MTLAGGVARTAYFIQENVALSLASFALVGVSFAAFYLINKIKNS